MLHALITCIKLFKKAKKNALGCINAFLLYSNHPHVSATHVVIFRLVRTKNTNWNFDVYLTVHHSIDIFHVTNLMHNSFILQQYVCHIIILNMFRAAPCSSSGGQIVLLQPLVSSLSVNGRTVCRLTADCSIDLFQVTNLMHNSFIL